MSERAGVPVDARLSRTSWAGREREGGETDGLQGASLRL